MPQPDTLLEGKYEIVSKLREGGMGTLYLVRHRLLDRVRVIKVMRPHASADPDLRRRFLDEARMATRLDHPNLCTIHDFAIDEDATAYLVMEFIEGVNIAELLGLQGPPGLPLSLEIAHQALLALGYLHRKNVVHRDVAPDNLMLSKTEDGRALIKVIDLGIAKAADQTIEMTATGVFLGKLRYASPEMSGALGPGEKLDGRSDLYSLGIVLYELLTGVRPFSGSSPAELLRGQLFNPPLPFAQSDPEGRVPEELRAVLLKALEKKRQDRYESAEEFDQKILVIQREFERPEELERTRAMLSEIPKILNASPGPVTGSAQSRLNQQFVASTTPPPSSPHLTIAPTESATPSNAPVLPPPQPPPSEDAGAAPSPPPRAAEIQPRRPWALVALAVAIVAASFFLIRRRAPEPLPKARDTAPSSSPANVAPAIQAESALALPTPLPTAEPTPEPPPSSAQPKAVVPEPPARARPARSSRLDLPKASRQGDRAAGHGDARAADSGSRSRRSASAGDSDGLRRSPPSWWSLRRPRRRCRKGIGFGK